MGKSDLDTIAKLWVNLVDILSLDSHERKKIWPINDYEIMEKLVGFLPLNSRGHRL